MIAAPYTPMIPPATAGESPASSSAGAMNVMIPSTRVPSTSASRTTVSGHGRRRTATIAPNAPPAPARAAAGAPEPPRAPAGSALGAVGALLRRPWPLTVVLLALVEGTVVLGVITFMAPALEEAGLSAAVAGLTMGVYGAAIMAWTRAVRLVALRLDAPRLIALGSALMAVGFLAAAIDPGLGGILAAALLVAGGFAFLHSTLQTWATEVAPDLRATAVSLFAAALFTGGAVGTAIVGPLAGSGEFAAVFLIGVAVTVVLGAGAAIARSRWTPKASPSVGLRRPATQPSVEAGDVAGNG